MRYSRTPLGKTIYTRVVILGVLLMLGWLPWHTYRDATRMGREAMIAYRADASDERPGAGIGIPLVFSTVTLYGGTFDCDSAPGKGTTITITLPFDMTPRHPLLKRAFNRCRTWFTATRGAEQQELLDNPHNS